MAGFTLGSYVPYKSFIHKMDSRQKILALILLMVAIFMPLTNFTSSFIVSGTIFIFLLVIMCIAHVSLLNLLKSLRALWFLIIFLMLINIFIPISGTNHPAFNIGDFTVYWDSILQSLKIILRLFMMIQVTMILTSTTKPLDLTYGLEWYMSPLKLVKFPAHEIAMVISIALRFVPTLLDEADRIMKAQASRGVDFKHGSIKMKFKSVIALIIPLFVSSFQRSEELANAMEARNYDPRAKRSRYHVLKFHFKDLFSFLVCGAIMGFIIYLSVANIDILGVFGVVNAW